MINSKFKRLFLNFLFCIVVLFAFNGCSFWAANKIDAALPSWPMLYLELRDFAKRSDMFVDSDFWRYIKKLDITPLFADANLNVKLKNNYVKNISRFEESLNSKYWREVFGKEMAVAFYPSLDMSQKTSASSLDDLRINLSRFIVAGRISFIARTATQLSVAFKDSFKNVNISADNYLGRSLYTLSHSGGGDLYFTTVDKYIYISPTKDLIKQSIYSRNNKRFSLRNQSTQKKYKNSLARGTWAAGYFDLSRFRMQALKYFELSIQNIKNTEDQLLKQQKFLQQLNNVSGIDKLSFVFNRRGNDFEHARFEAFYDENNLSDFLAHSIRKPNRKNISLDFMPVDTRFYMWHTNMEFDLWWNSFVMISDAAKVEAIRSSIASYIGMSLDRDILPIISKDVGFFAAPLSSSQIDSLAMSMFLSVKNTSAAESLMVSLSDKLPISFKELKYRDISVKRTTIKLSDALEPAYCSLGKYIMLNSSFTGLRKSIDAQKNSQKSIHLSDDFKSIDFGLSDKNLSSSYIDMSYFLALAKKSLNSNLVKTIGNQFIASQPWTAKVGTVDSLNILLLPLLDSLDFVDSLASRVFKQKNRVVADFYTKLNY